MNNPVRLCRQIFESLDSRTHRVLIIKYTKQTSCVEETNAVVADAENAYVDTLYHEEVSDYE